MRPEGVDATGHGRGAGLDAIAALVLLALTTRLPMRSRGSQDEPGCVPGIAEGGCAMRRYRTRGSLAVLGALLVVALGATAAAAEAPVKETITFSDTFQDEFLTEACGVEVTTTVTGRITFFTFPIDRSARRT